MIAVSNSSFSADFAMYNSLITYSMKGGATSGNSSAPAGPHIIDPVAVMLGKFNHMPSWGWEHTPDFVNLNPIVEGLTGVLNSLNKSIAETTKVNVDTSPNKVQNKASLSLPELNADSNSAKSSESKDQALTIRDKIKMAMANQDSVNKEFETNKTLVASLDRENAHKPATFKEKVRALLKDFGIKDV